MLVTAGAARRQGPPRRRLAIVVPSTRVVGWRPMVAVSLIGTVVLATGDPNSVAEQLSGVSACLAAAACYVIHDPAAATTASVPTSLPVRRLLRVAMALAGCALGWLVATLVVTHRVPGVPVWPSTLELATFASVGLAVAALASSKDEGSDGTITGVVVTLSCFASTFVPGPRWLPFPADPAAPGAATRLVVLLAGSALLLTAASRDPAGRS